MSGLLLTRHAGEQIIIDDGRIVITVEELRRSRGVRLRIEAPPNVSIDRAEVWNARQPKKGESQHGQR